MDRHRTGRSHTAEGRKGSHRLCSKPPKGSISPGQDRVPHVQGRPPLPPRSYDDGKQLRGTQRVRTEVLEPLTRALGPGKLPDT